MNTNSTDNLSAEDGGAIDNRAVMRRLSEIERAEAEAWETMFIGIMAKRMGYAEQGKVCQAGREAFRLLAKMNQTEFRNIKRYLGGA